jgi:hypothetical protein
MISNWMRPDKGRAGSDAVRHYANYTSRHVPSIDTVVKQQDQTVTAGPHELRRCGLAPLTLRAKRTFLLFRLLTVVVTVVPAAK